MRGRRLWLRVQVHGGSIPVYVDKGPLVSDEGYECDAFYERDTPQIVVKWTGNVAAMKQKLHHELLHVCFGAHTGDAREPLFGRSVGARDKKEELIVSFLEPVQFDLLVRNGWLRYPNPPRIK